MEAESSFSVMAPPVFNDDNYQIWAVRMEIYLDAMDMWEEFEEDYEVPLLPNNPTMAQIKNHKDRKIKKSKANACLFSALSSSIFTRVMSLKSAKVTLDYLKAKYEGDERIRGMQVLNLIRDFEMQKMKETETIKDYSERLLNIANRAQEQQRVMREEGNTVGALFAKPQDGSKNKKKKNKKNGEGISTSTTKGKTGHSKKSYPLCKHCNKKGHPPYKCWKRPDVKCSKCNQLGHETVICKNNSQQQEAKAKLLRVRR
ncbi:uncharacterized protein LOC114077489 [Solanum pennellii]|uniref:Uncharacterized protein LOC114077489 n=1 Tax=Solanum pennellii TaxID=28526 RepID=A0ABM1VBU8_SOLPN|nr:uncharacterized protein LOC114077489 [Solanum pennellii]